MLPVLAPTSLLWDVLGCQVSSCYWGGQRLGKAKDEMGTAAGWPMACGCRQELKLEPWESLSGFVWTWLTGTAGPVGVWHGDLAVLLWRLCRKITLES